MRDQPRITVIIPTYNRAHMVGRAIRSVLAQTFRDFELIVVDDGSTDRTDEMLRALHDPRIRHLRHEVNRGAQAARNTGLDAVRGEYISFLDSDDEWRPQKLEQQMELFARNPHGLRNLGVVLTGSQYVRLDSGHRSEPVIHDCHGDVRPQVFLRKVHGQMPALVRKDVFAQAGHYDERLPAAQDWDMLVRLAGICQFDAVRQPLYVRHHHNGDRVRTSANVIRAYRILFEKYAALFALYPQYTSRLRAYLSARCLEQDAPQVARREACLSIQLNPCQAKAYACWLLSLLDGRVYRVLGALKRQEARRR